MSEPLKVIDVSHHNVIGDILTVEENHIDGVYIRIKSGNTNDRKAEEHLRKAVQAGIPYGFYYYSYATDEYTAELECQNFLDYANNLMNTVGVCPQLPYVIDMEDADGYKKKKKALETKTIKSILRGAVNVFIKNQVSYLVYMSLNWWQKYDIQNVFISSNQAWCARWSKTAEEPGMHCVAWQFSSDEEFKTSIGDIVKLDCSWMLSSVMTPMAY